MVPSSHVARAMRSTSSSRLACTHSASRSACWKIITFIGTSPLVALSLTLLKKILQNQTIIFENHSITLHKGAAILFFRMYLSKGERHGIQTVRQFRDESLAHHFGLHGFWRPIPWHA